MNILVLDTIHGGTEIAAAYSARGHRACAVDVYRNGSDVTVDDALAQDYNLVVAPVHLDPDHPLLVRNSGRLITHHEAVRDLLGSTRPHPMIEITGARGKTTTALALAACFPGEGVVHTSNGTYRFPDRTLLWKKSITPASVLPAAQYAKEHGCWLVAEESLGVTGAGDLAIITSAEDYPVARMKRSALALKKESVQRSPRVLVAPSVDLAHPDAVRVDDMASIEGETCTIHCHGFPRTFTNPLLALRGYRTPLMLAGCAAALLGGDPERLSEFSAIEGRMSVSREQGRVIVDNSNSGTNAAVTAEAASYARRIARKDTLTLVIGEEARAVCEGFSPADVSNAIGQVRPDRVILVDPFGTFRNDPLVARALEGKRVDTVGSWAGGRARALAGSGDPIIVLAVKRWN